MIEHLFWLLVPAERAVRDLGLNRKTVQKYYLQLRHRIAQTTDKEALRLSGEIEVDNPILVAIKKVSEGVVREERFLFLSLYVLPPRHLHSSQTSGKNCDRCGR